MTNLLMETEAVRAMAGKLKQVAGEIRTQAQSLNGSAENMDWDGPSRDEFVMEGQAITRQLEAQAELGVVLAGRIEIEVVEWEEMAATLMAAAVLVAPPPPLSAHDQARLKVQENWGKMSFDERKNWIKNWYKELCQNLGIPPVEFKVEDLLDPEGKDYRGVFSGGLAFGLFSSITIDTDNVNDSDPFLVLETIGHETEHQYQQYLVDHPDKRPSEISEEQIKIWREYIGNYKNADDDFEAYRKQPIEDDARRAGEQAVRDYLDSGKEVI